MEHSSGLGKSFSAPNSVERSASTAGRPGILVFSHTMQLLHVNRRALELVGRNGQTEVGSVSSLLSTSVTKLHAKVREDLESRAAAGIWEPFEVRRTDCEFGRTVLLRGFGLLDQTSSDRSRVVIFLEEDLSVREEVPQQAEETLFLALQF